MKFGHTSMTSGMDVSKKNVKELNTICLNLGIEIDETMGKGKLLSLIHI